MQSLMRVSTHRPATLEGALQSCGDFWTQAVKSPPGSCRWCLPWYLLSLKIAGACDNHCPLSAVHLALSAACCVQPGRAGMCRSSRSPLLLCADTVLLEFKELPPAAAAVGLIPDNQTAAVLPELRELQVPPASWIHDMRTPPPHIILAEFHRQMGHSTRSEGESEGAATQWAGESCLLCTCPACGRERAG